MTKQAEITRIAQKILGLETLETRNMDDQDFYDLAVWQIEEALKAAYEAGKKSSK